MVFSCFCIFNKHLIITVPYCVDFLCDISWKIEETIAIFLSVKVYIISSTVPLLLPIINNRLWFWNNICHILVY